MLYGTTKNLSLSSYASFWTLRQVRILYCWKVSFIDFSSYLDAYSWYDISARICFLFSSGWLLSSISPSLFFQVNPSYIFDTLGCSTNSFNTWFRDSWEMLLFFCHHVSDIHREADNRNTYSSFQHKIGGHIFDLYTTKFSCPLSELNTASCIVSHDVQR